MVEELALSFEMMCQYLYIYFGFLCYYGSIQWICKSCCLHEVRSWVAFLMFLCMLLFPRIWFLWQPQFTSWHLGGSSWMSSRTALSCSSLGRCAALCVPAFQLSSLLLSLWRGNWSLLKGLSNSVREKRIASQSWRRKSAGPRDEPVSAWLHS